MKTRFALLILIITVSNACSKNKIKEQNDTSSSSLLKQDSVIVNDRLTELIRTVLNFPSVIKFSKSEFIQKKYGKAFVFFDGNTLHPNDSIIYQNGFALEVTQDRESLDNPCYVFKKIDIRENTAYVLLHFDITGFICYGNLNYIDGKWVPDKDFQVGFR